MTLTRAQGYALYANEYLYMDNVEAVTITSVDDPALLIENVYAKPLPFTHDVTNTELGEVDKRHMAWILFVATLGGQEPRRGWVLTRADGSAYSLKEGFTRHRWDTQWRGESIQEIEDNREAVVL